MPIKVNQMSDAATAMQADLCKVDCLMGGTRTMRQAKEKYLPKWPMEDMESYDFRLKSSTLFNAFARTINNMAGKPFSEPVKWTEIDPQVEEWLDNVDLTGRNLHVFSQDVFRAGLKDGITHVLVDYPTTVDKKTKAPLYKTKDAELKAGVRPYLVHIKQTQILGWMSETINGKETLVMIRFMEVASEPDGDYGCCDVQQVKVLRPGVWEIYRKKAVQVAGIAADEWELYDNGTTSLSYIPFHTFYTNRTGFMTASPPLNDLADLNIKHWQSQSDQDTLLHTARVPILAITGVNQDTKIEIGNKAALMLPMNCTAEYVEHTGAAIEAGRNSLKDLESHMESMGAELIIVRPGTPTATEAAIDSAQSQCQLTAMANAYEDFIDQCIDTMAAWVGMEEQGHVDIFDEFATLAIDATSVGPFVAALVTLVNSGLMCRESAFEELKRYGIANPDLVWEEEQERIQNEMMGYEAPAPAPVVPADPDGQTDPNESEAK